MSTRTPALPTAYGYPRLFHGNSRIRDVSTMTTHGSAHVFCMELSPDGRSLAIGDEDGMVEIRVLRGTTWRRVCLYNTGGAVRTLAWHPCEATTLFSGSANGALHKVTVVRGGNNILCDALVPGYIHLIRLSTDGQKLVVAYGRTIAYVNNPFPQRNYLGALFNLDIATPDTIRTITDYQIPRGIFFIPRDETTILVAFFGRRGLRAYSLVDRSFLWSIPLREDAFIGSAAISPSGERIAIMNLDDGIDFYSTSRRQFLSTTRYTLSVQIPPQNFIVDILFVDDETVAFGHSDGHIAFATFGVDNVDTLFEMGNAQASAPVQVITFGLVDSIPLILGIASPLELPQSSIRYPSDIHIGRIETPGMPQQEDLSGHGTGPSAHARTQLSPYAAHAAGVSVTSALTLLVVIILSVLVKQALLDGSTNTTTPSDCTQSTCTTAAMNPRPAEYHAITTISSSFDPLSTCICTVTGTIDGV